AIEVVQARLVAAWRALPTLGGLWLPLTAGYDSRLLLAAARAAEVDVTTFTFENPRMSRADRDLPPALARIPNVEHRLIEPDGRRGGRLQPRARSRRAPARDRGVGDLGRRAPLARGRLARPLLPRAARGRLAERARAEPRRRRARPHPPRQLGPCARRADVDPRGAPDRRRPPPGPRRAPRA